MFAKQGDGLNSICRFSDEFHVGLLLKRESYAIAYERMIVNAENFDALRNKHRFLLDKAPKGRIREPGVPLKFAHRRAMPLRVNISMREPSSFESKGLSEATLWCGPKLKAVSSSHFKPATELPFRY
jgi:hypothetical protein